MRCHPQNLSKVLQSMLKKKLYKAHVEIMFSVPQAHELGVMYEIMAQMHFST